MSKPDEAAFETHISEWLAAHGGYGPVKVGVGGEGPPEFDAHLGLDTAELFAFIGATQAEQWELVLKSHGGDQNAAQRAFATHLAKELDRLGTMEVLRKGIVYAGSHKAEIRLAYFKPAHGLSERIAQRYAANRLTVMRQVPYDPASAKTLDLCLFCNGIPVATAELKNPLTGQTFDHAREQYRNDRDPKNTTLANRAVVHFALDTEQVFMTTRLDGRDTKFLPFNRGNQGAAGNPANPDGHRTAYLWKEVWERHAWLDLLGRFIHVEPAETPKNGRRASGVRGAGARGATIFPRYHQWQAVLRLEEHAAANGPGQNYLVQHSAGSGKSNTIAWLSYRLANLHAGPAGAETKVFDKVVVITDRVVLDRQLQDTIFRLDHTRGVVQKIDDNSAQLAEALAGEQAKIIITTLQKFPHVLNHVGELAERNYAVIVDEAHSSQTGESAKDMKRVLGTATATDDAARLAAAEAAEISGIEEVPDPVEDLLAEQVAARGRQPNLSFFAFTATPKARTLELFGTPDETGRPVAFDLYSMRQAIEEGFIHDVLANYVTYETYWELEKKVAEDPEYDSAKASAAIARFVDLHETNLAQRAEVIVNHFQQHVRRRIGGQAKAMVVTASRLHAYKYQQALKKHCADHGVDLGVLVAFSGSLTPDVTGEADDVTESKANGFPDTETPRRFDTDEFQIMVVAEKYQTGFDQPKLYAMYVDKTLSSLAAVQTLSRLNRTAPNKDGTFVLDFRNTTTDIQDAFSPWYTSTVAQPSDPHLLYETRHALDEYDVLRAHEIEAAIALLLTDGARNHDRFHSQLSPAIDRLVALDEEEQDEFRDHLTRFVRAYSFLSQVVQFGDTKLERAYLYCRALARFVRREPGYGVDLGDQVALVQIAMEKSFEGSASLDPSIEGDVATVFSGSGPRRADDEVPLSEIVEQMNEKFAADFTSEHFVAYQSVADGLVDDRDVQRAAVANDAKGFDLAIANRFQEGVIGMWDVAQEAATAYLDKPDFAAELRSLLLPGVQTRARVANQQHCPIGELLDAGESKFLEYKSSLRVHTQGDDVGQVFKPLETASLKTIAAFMNSKDGGTLLIGAAEPPGENRGRVVGLDADYASLAKPGKDPRDLFALHLGNLVASSMGIAAATHFTSEIHTVGGNDVCRVHVQPAHFPVEATVTVAKKGQLVKKTAFYVRVDGQTREIDDPAEREHLTASKRLAD